MAGGAQFGYTLGWVVLAANLMAMLVQALIPLVAFTARRSLMGTLANLRLTNVAAVCVTAVIVALNVYLLAAG